MAEIFDKLKKQYNLPDLDEIEEVFEISVDEEKENLILQAVRNAVADKLYELLKTLESVIFTGEGSDPDALYEEKMVEGVSKDGFDLYKKFNYYYYFALRLRYEHDRKKDAEFLLALIKDWKEMEKSLKLFFAQMEKGWKDMAASSKIDDENYHG